MNRLQATFLTLVVVQGLHSIEEYYGRLYEVFPPARFVSGLISSDLRRGFIIFNLALIAFAFYCFLGPILRGWRSAMSVAWIWVGIELVNGVGHPLWSLTEWGYTPGVATAPILLILALSLAAQLQRIAVQTGQVGVA